MITVYSKDDCPFCVMAKQYLTRNDFEYEEINIVQNQEAREFIISEGHTTVPQIYHNGELLVEGGGQALSRMDPNMVRKLITENTEKETTTDAISKFKL